MRHGYKHMKILFVDDDPSLVRFAEEVLPAFGIDVCGAFSGDEGLDVIDEQAFDVAVVDIFMPGRDGMEVIADLRERHPQTKILAISGMNAQEWDFLKAAKALGADMVLRKPFSASKLAMVLRRLNERH